MRRRPSAWGARRRQSINDPSVLALLGQGRRQDVYGNWKSTPGATRAWQDAREPMPGDNFGGGLTPSSTWNSFFKNTPRPGSSLGDMGVTGQQAKNDMPSLAPDNPTPASDLAEWAQPDAWQPSASNPASYTAAVADGATKYFNDQGAPMPADMPGTFNAAMHGQPFGPMPDLFQDDDLLGSVDAELGF